MAEDRRNEYLTIIRRKAVFEIAGFDDPEAVELTEHWFKTGGKKRLRRNTPETWAKLKYDRQIVAIAATRRVECIYSTDRDLHAFAKDLGLKAYDLADLPLPPPVQMVLDETDDDRQETTHVRPTQVSGRSSGPVEGETTTEGRWEEEGGATKPAEAGSEVTKEDEAKGAGDTTIKG